MGLDLFKRNSSTTAASVRPSSPSSPLSVAAGSPPRGTVVMGEMGHQFRMTHNRLIQWRFANARSDAANCAKLVQAESSLLSAWAGMSKLQASVIQKRRQLQKEKLRFKLDTLLYPQLNALETWGDMESQHASALNTTKDCLQSAVSRVPLVDGAEANPHSLSIELRRAMDLAAAIKNETGDFSPMAEKTVPLLSELAQVVTGEKSLLEECFELQGLLVSLQLQEQSLKCHLIQLYSQQQNRQSTSSFSLMNT